MIDQVNPRPGDLPSAPDSPTAFRPASHQLAFPRTLAGTWPAPASGQSADDDFRHVAALDAIAKAVAGQGDGQDRLMHRQPKIRASQITEFVRRANNAALTSLCQRVLRSMRSSDSVPGMSSLFGRADSQGRMDPMARLPGKFKEFVNAAVAGQRPFTGMPSRSRP